MGQSTQTIQRQRDQPVISQVADEEKAEGDGGQGFAASHSCLPWLLLQM